MTGRRRELSRSDVMREAFAQEFERAAPFREDRALSGDLAREAEPALAAMTEVSAATQEPLRELDHEPSALLTLLGRRAGLLGATPSTALAVGRGVIVALSSAGVEMLDRVREHIVAVVIEGYAAARDERMTLVLQEASARAMRLVELVPHCHAVFVLPGLEADVFEPMVAELERELLRRDVRCLVLVFAHSEGCDGEVARQLASLAATAIALGARCVLTDVTEAQRDELMRHGFERLEVQWDGSLASALPRVFTAVGYELRPRRRFRAPQLFRRATNGDRERS